MEAKKCSTCGQDKDKTESNFRLRRRKDRSEFFNAQCKECERKKSLDWRNKNIDKARENTKRWFKAHSNYHNEYKALNNDKIKLYQKEYERQNKDRIKKYKKERSEKLEVKNRIRELAKTAKYINNRKKYYNDNKPKILEKIKIYRQTSQAKILKKQYAKTQRIKNTDNMTYRLRLQISKRIHENLLKTGGSKNGSSILRYLPYTMIELKNHLESQFESWMDWSNWGRYNSKIWDDKNPSTWTWQLDHIKPASEFYYKSMAEPEFFECWALKNLRPYSAKQNCIDGASRIRHTSGNNSTFY
jgi:hypothetical protein